LARISGQYSSYSLVPPNVWSMAERFFKRPKLHIRLWQTTEPIDENRSKIHVYFHVINVGANTANHLRAAIITGEKQKTPFSKFFKLRWTYPDSDRQHEDVSLSYLAEADAIFLSGVLRVVKNGDCRECFLDDVFLGKIGKEPERITDVYLMIAGVGGLGERYWMWLVATGDLKNPFIAEEIPLKRLRYLRRLARKLSK